MKPLVLLVYYERPKMVRGALESLRKQGENWRCVFIDDGSATPGRPIVERDFPDLLPRMEFVRLNDTPQDKVWNGSRHPDAMNDAILRATEDIVVVLCDDDALVEGYLPALCDWYEKHPELPWSYCHVSLYVPGEEEVPWGVMRLDHWLNAPRSPINPYCKVDSSQVTVRRQAFVDGLRWPSGNTVNNDAGLYARAHPMLGPCPWNGLVGQYKGSHKDQMGRRQVKNIYKVETR